MGCAGIGRIRAGEQRHVRSSKLAHGLLGGGIIRRRPWQRRKRTVQLGLAAGSEVRGDDRVPRQCCAAAPAGDAFEHCKRRDHKSMMRRHKPAKIRLWRAVNEKVLQPISPRFHGLASVLE